MKNKHHKLHFYFIICLSFFISINLNSQCLKFDRIVGKTVTWNYRSWMFSPDTIFIASNGELFKSTNAGTSFVKLVLPTVASKNFRQMQFLQNNTIGYVAGGSGTVIKSTNRGVTWTDVSCPITKTIKALYFYHPDSGYIGTDNGQILRTFDGGLTWDSISKRPNSASTLTCLYFFNKKKGFAGGTAGALYLTQDGGSTWKNFTSGDTMITGIVFPTNLIGYACGSHGFIAKTTDGGLTWNRQYSNFTVEPTNTFWDIRFSSADTGIAGGGLGRIYRTVDGGKTWYDTWFMLSGGQEVRGLSLYNSKYGFAACTGGEVARISPINGIGAASITITNDSLTSTTASNYQWYKNGKMILSSNYQKIKSTTAGLFQVVTQTSSMCYSISNVFNYTLVPLFENTNAMHTPTVYPNPVTTYSKIYNATSFEIYNINGVLIEKSYNQNEIQEAFKHVILTCTKGIYILKLTNDKKSVSYKLVVN